MQHLERLEKYTKNKNLKDQELKNTQYMYEQNLQRYDQQQRKIDEENKVRQLLMSQNDKMVDLLQNTYKNLNNQIVNLKQIRSNKNLEIMRKEFLMKKQIDSIDKQIQEKTTTINPSLFNPPNQKEPFKMGIPPPNMLAFMQFQPYELEKLKPQHMKPLPLDHAFIFNQQNKFGNMPIHNLSLQNQNQIIPNRASQYGKGLPPPLGM